MINMAANPQIAPRTTPSKVNGWLFEEWAGEAPAVSDEVGVVMEPRVLEGLAVTVCSIPCGFKNCAALSQLFAVWLKMATSSDELPPATTTKPFEPCERENPLLVVVGANVEL
jgi:hypothetical protein